MAGYLAWALQRPIEAIDQSFIAKWLLQETRGSRSQSISASVFCRQSAHKNDRPTVTIGDKSVPKIYSCHPWHLNVGNDAYDDAQNWRCRWGRVAEIWGADQKVVASRLCALRASTSAVRQADRLRAAAHPVVNIRTSHPVAPALECSDVRLVGQETRKRVVEVRCPVTVPREISSLSRMKDDRTNIIVSQQRRDLVFGDWASAAIFVPRRVWIGQELLHHLLRCYFRAVLG